MLPKLLWHGKDMHAGTSHTEWVLMAEAARRMGTVIHPNAKEEHEGSGEFRREWPGLHLMPSHGLLSLTMV